MANTELRQIRHLVALGKHLSFTKAAGELGITQSALTRSVQAIEHQAGVRLFDRDRGRVIPSETGKFYLKRAEGLLLEAEDLDRLLYQSASGEVGEVQFAITSAVARAIMPDILTRELVDRPQLRSKIHIRSPESMVAMVQAEEIEFCVCGELSALPEALKSMPMITFPLALLVRKDHPLLLDGMQDFDLRGYPLVLSGQVTQSDAIPDIALPLQLSRPSIIIDEIGSLARIVANSDAIWLTIPQAASDSLRFGILRELPLPEGLEMSFRAVMYSHVRRTLSPAARSMVDLMRNEGAKISPFGTGSGSNA